MPAISKGKISKATKYVIYGVEGVGKTSLAMAFPQALFSDMEGSTYRYDTLRFTPHKDPATGKNIYSWKVLRAEIAYVQQHPEICKTYVIDTIDAAIRCYVDEFCAAKQLKGIEDIGYGKGWEYVKEEVGRALNDLQDIVNNGIDVILVSHAITAQFDDPTTLASYTRYSLKIKDKISALIKEWADTVLFMNFEVQTVTTGQGFAAKNKGQSQKRMIYTTRTAAFDAKNRDGLPEAIEYTDAANVLAVINKARNIEFKEVQDEVPFTFDVPVKENMTREQVTLNAPAEQQPLPQEENELDRLPAKVDILAKAAGVTAEDIRKAVASRGYFPVDMPVTDYPTDFVEGVLVAAWEQVLSIIQK